jgi:hypothetical protein
LGAQQTILTLAELYLPPNEAMLRH